MIIFVLIDALHPRKQFFSHVGLGLPVLNQYKAAVLLKDTTQ